VRKIFFFSNNKNKISEVTDFFKKTKFNILNLNNFSNIKMPHETGVSFEENAKIKSLCGFQKTNYPCFADDSGFCIRGLKNFPGIKSKRFIEENDGLTNALKMILNKTKHLSNNKAFFETSISFTLNKHTSITFNGTIDGIITKELRGNKGFGYDPIFIPNGHKKTFAEMEFKEKNKTSHRSIAIMKFKKYLLNSFDYNSISI